jgi:hypothetical protein
MSDKRKPGIYLIVEFDWPRPSDPEAGKKAYHLHQVLQNRSWIREVVAASGGVGKGPSSMWIFWLENYAALDRLLKDRQNEVSQAYVAFFAAMPKQTEKVREEVIFG